ncbi:MAG: hypothetical protein LYZ69_03015 [Nitrososphaerales archaeon]|nr:hypothetical protein [Nitrososphaerales archaeon]
MAGRRAVGASLAAAVIFSSVLISNFILVSAERQKFEFTSIAAEERGLYDQAVVVKAAAITDLLDKMQDSLSSRTFQCSDATTAITLLASTEKVDVGWEGVFSSGKLSAAPQQTIQDDVLALAPFNGTAAGLADFEVRLSVDGKAPDSSVALGVNETHLVNLPIRLPALVSTCLQSVDVVLSGLEGIGGQLCNATIVESTITSIGSSLRSAAASSGFSLSISYSTVPGTACAASFTVLVSQYSIDGPEGPFTFSASESAEVQWYSA